MPDHKTMSRCLLKRLAFLTSFAEGQAMMFAGPYAAILKLWYT